MPYDYQEKLAAQAHRILYKARFTIFETNRLEARMVSLDEKIIRTTSLTIVKKDQSIVTDLIGNNRMQLADIRDKYVSKIVEAEQNSQYIANCLNGIDSELERIVLKLYYLDAMSIQQIARKLNYSKRYIIRIKKNALVNYLRVVS